jgi:hypothetical protein
MTHWKTEHIAPQRRTGHTIGAPARHPDFAALAVVGAAPVPVALLVLWFVPLPLVLPVLSIVSFAIAGATALLAHWSGIDRRAAGVTAWDISALFTAIWILAGLASGARPLAELFDRLAMHP